MRIDATTAADKAARDAVLAALRPHADAMIQAEAVAAFRALWLAPATDARHLEQLSAIQAEIRGKNLACWCAILDRHGNYAPCHADVLLEIANRPIREEII